MSRLGRPRDDSGFTLIELLVVVIIIGILAGIAVPIFLSQRSKAWAGAIKSDLHHFAEDEEIYFNDNEHYAGTAAEMTADGENVRLSPAGDYAGGVATITIAKLYDGQSPPNVVTVDTQAVGGYCLEATTAAGATWHYDSVNGGLLPGGC
jgi:prepilin-type N-terminal cleavage/methylation domain-containing protein